MLALLPVETVEFLPAAPETAAETLLVTAEALETADEEPGVPVMVVWATTSAGRMKMAKRIFALSSSLRLGLDFFTGTGETHLFVTVELGWYILKDGVLVGKTSVRFLGLSSMSRRRRAEDKLFRRANGSTPRARGRGVII